MKTEKMTAQEIQQAVQVAVASGNWIIRADNDGTAYNGFRWSSAGEWTEAPDWSPDSICGGGLHGLDKDHGWFGLTAGSRLVFCDTDGEHVDLDDKIKVRRARILLINALPEGLTVGGSLNLSGCTSLTSLPESLAVGGWLDLSGCTSLTSLPESLAVGGNTYGWKEPKK